MQILENAGVMLVATLALAGTLQAQTPSSGPVVIDTFQSMRTNDLSGGPPPPDWNHLWWAGGEHSGQTCDTMTGISNGTMVIAAPASGTCTGQMVDGKAGPGMANVTFFPRNDGGNGWVAPCTTHTNGCEYVQAYAMGVPAGTDWTKLNRLYFTITSDTTNPLYRSFTVGSMNLGYYVRSHDNSASQNQGAHYYNYIDTGVYAGQTLYFVMNRKPQHNNTAQPTQLWAEDPEFNQCCWGQGEASPVHWWDGETYFYIAAGVNLGSLVGNITFSPFTLGVEPYSEPDDYVAALTGTYVGSGQESGFNNTYEVTWAVPKMVPGGITYHIHYSSAGSMHVNGWSTGTDGGTINSASGTMAGDNSPYTNVWWNSASVSKATNMWVAIRPDIPIWAVTQQGAGTSIRVQTRSPYDRHWLQTGDSVTISGLCTAANGTRTVTVIDNFTVDLGVQGSCSYSGYRGPTSGIMTATSNTQNFTEILIGPGSGAAVSGSTQFSRCDLNHDGAVNSLDYSLAQQQALGQSSCTADLDGNGTCNIVEVQRVADAANGGTCKVGQ